jgi:hypothetical protein
MLLRVLDRLTYANVTASVAMFVALGGTGYAALSLPRDSVGSRELRARSVAHSELGRDAVTSDNVRDGSLGVRDLSRSARERLAGQNGPMGAPGTAGAVGAKGDTGTPGKDAVTLWAVVNHDAVRYAGTATAASHDVSGGYLVSFSRTVAGCAASATLARVHGDFADPPPGRVTVAEESGAVHVRTFNMDGLPEDIGFHLIVVC